MAMLRSTTCQGFRNNAKGETKMEKARKKLEAMSKLCDKVTWNKDKTGYFGRKYIGCGEFIREYTYIHKDGIKTIARIY